MGATPEQQAVAALIDKAIRDANLSRTEVARLLGVHKSAVTKWCQAKNAPDTATMTQLAAITGKPVTYFYGGRATDPHAALLELLMEIGRQVAGGLSVPQALVATGGQAAPLTPEVIADMEPLADAFRQRLREISGRSWETLTAEEQRVVLARFAESLAGPPPDSGRRGGQSGDTVRGSARSVH